MVDQSEGAAVRIPVAWIGALLGCLVALTIIGSSAVVVALPVLQEDLGLDLAGSAWVIAAFALSFSVSTALFGRLADLRGLRMPLQIGVALLACGSLLAAGAWSFPSLVTGRLLQGAGGGAVPVLATGIITARFPGESRGRALGTLMAVVSVVSGAGPLIGGGVTQIAGWRWVLAVPVVALLLVVPVSRLAPSAPPSPAAGRRLDARGAALVALTAAAITLVLQSPATGGGLPVAAAFSGLSLIGALALRAHVRSRPSGFVPRELLANRALMLSALSGLTLLAAYFAAMFTLPKILMGDQGWQPLHVGLALLPAAALGAVASRTAGGVAHRFGRFRVAAALAVVSAVGLLTAAAGHASPPLLVLGLGLTGAGFGGGQVALVDALPLLVDEGQQGGALGMFNLLFFTGGAVGSATIGGLAGVTGLPGALAVVALFPLGGAFAAMTARRFARDRVAQ